MTAREPRIVGPDQPGPRVRLIEGVGAVAALGDDWDALVAVQAVPNPTMTSAWLRELVSWEPGVPLVAMVEAEGRLLAGGVFGVRRPGWFVGPRVATWLGTDNYWCSPDLIVDPAAPRAAEALLEAVVAHVGAVELSLPVDGLAASALRSTLGRLHEVPRTDLWVTLLPPPRFDHAADRAAYELRRAERRGAAVEHRVARSPEDIRSALERMFVIHEMRWDGKQNAIERFSASEEHRAWYRRVIAAMVEKDAVRIVEILEDGCVIGSLLGLRVGSGAMLHLMAVAPGRHLRQPGHASLLAWVNVAVDDGAAVMDLGWGAGGPNSPKSRLGPTGIPIHEYVGARRGFDHAFLLGRRGLLLRRASAAQVMTRVRREAARLRQHPTKADPMSRLLLITKLPGSIRRRGWRATASTGWMHVRRSRTGRLHLYLSEAIFDLRHNVRTRGILKHEKVGSFEDAFRYEATPIWRIRRSLNDAPVDPGRFTFVDLGCGRGLVLLLAARQGFRRIVGVELSSDLAGVARENAASYRGRGSARSQVEVVESDATTWELPPEPVVVYVYNSFAMPGFERLAQTVDRSLREDPRELYLIYMFPESRAPLDRLETLDVVAENRRYVIYRTAASVHDAQVAGAE